ncbi:FAD-binding protein [Saccharothrix saharensis]|uniref:FAD-binding protein n=1 Tax=Saccharothrix saharensis TaxID=571190 RepID=UPI0036B13440
MPDPTIKTSPVLYFDPVGRRFTDQHSPDSVPLPELDHVLSIADAALDWAAEDYGRFEHHRPIAVARPGCVDDIGAVLRFATIHDIRVVPRAEGHSTAGQAQAPAGIVLDMRGLNTMHRVSADRVVVDAGTRWSAVLEATLPHGLAPPVLTDYLEMSVGGTLSVGGISGASHHFGAQTDNVLELDVYTADGTPVTCSPTANTHLFDAVRAGRGRHGVIARATLRLVPAHTHARCYHLWYDRLDRFLADQRTLMTERRFDHLEGQAKANTTGAWNYRIEATTYFTPPALPAEERLLDGLADLRHAIEVTELTYPRFQTRLSEDVALLRRLGPWQHPHPWSNLLLPDHTAEHIVTETLADLTQTDLGDTGVVLIYPLPLERFRTPSLALPDTPTSFLFALLRTAPQDDPDVLHQMVDDNHRLGRRAVAAGGTVYLGDINP